MADPAPRATEPDTHDPRPTPPGDVPVEPAGDGVPGDLGAPDIVGPTGEEMPVQHHDEVDTADDRGTRR